ncbi:ferrichrome ABC transporter permease [Paenibacillus sp. FSL A5-0031]|uniref:FecCD family ABC transporter permease n=1 Tax=Paenibacillus sp. FSL A5-0031 TaxID=1920420 RepID=UPI00096DAA4F|nr:iron ABC transporter permease [Paenibacillus sp. FSL A5-0031]OME88404.1 ferrichrome ABC transporter permease [Paenibacillus sp. FSL A5-0031]
MRSLLSRRIVQIVLFFIFLSVTIEVSITYGSKSISYGTVWNALFHFDSENMDHLIVQTSRFPRVVGALLIGAFMAVSGALMQGMTRNYLASPSIMGVADGSVFLITLCMIFLPGASSMTLIMFSLIGSALGATLVFSIARLMPSGMSPLTLAILGTIIGTFLSGISQALSTYYQVSQNISFWYNARLHQMDPTIIKWSIPFAIVGLVLAFVVTRSITAISLGDDVAQGLGINLIVMKALTMLSVVILTGISVAMAGSIAFIGLIIPHITRIIVGQDYRKIIPLTAVLGAFFLAWSDIISRFLNHPFETPIGVVTALFGVPYFLYLVKTRGGRST